MSSQSAVGVTPAAACALVATALAIKGVVAATAEEVVWTAVADQDVAAGGALDLLDVAVNLACIATAASGVGDRAADYSLDEDAGVLDAGEGGAVVAAASVEAVTIARLAPDQEVAAAAAGHALGPGGPLIGVFPPTFPP